MATADQYDAFLEHITRLTNIGTASQVLSWDQQVMMPEGGTPARSQQLSALSSIHHELLTSDETARYLDALDRTALDGEQTAVVREIERQYERAASVDQSLIEDISQTTSEALPVWEQAKSEDDFASFAPTLERIVELKREYAAQIDPDDDPYAVLFAEYEPYLDLETTTRILDRLRDRLVELIDRIEANGAAIETDAFSGEYPVEQQETLGRSVLETLGYPFEHGRIDTAPHPFSTGTQFDARVTTRYNETDPLEALTSTIHEFGHATYTLGLPREDYGTPLGQSRNLSVHESQSRLWENHVGRSKAFWEGLLPTVTETFPSAGSLTPQDVYEAINQVYPDNTIRVAADELTYHLHIIIRFEIEKALVRGEIEVDAIPQLWNDKMESYLGVRPETDAEGCLQDIHWTHGNFGYFPTYSLGSVLAAQLYHAAETAIDGLDEQIRAGEFGELHEWLTESVHQHGQRYTTPALIEVATGEEFTAEYFLEYVEQKFTDLYQLQG